MFNIFLADDYAINPLTSLASEHRTMLTSTVTIMVFGFFCIISWRIFGLVNDISDSWLIAVFSTMPLFLHPPTASPCLSIGLYKRGPVWRWLCQFQYMDKSTGGWGRYYIAVPRNTFSKVLKVLQPLKLTLFFSLPLKGDSKVQTVVSEIKYSCSSSQAKKKFKIICKV